jgi:hypothetical protein
MVSEAVAQSIQIWPIDKLIFYARNPRKRTPRWPHVRQHPGVRLQDPRPYPNSGTAADAMSSATFREAEKPAPAGADGQEGEQRYG